jgi:hypothetical protein
LGTAGIQAFTASDTAAPALEAGGGVDVSVAADVPQSLPLVDLDRGGTAAVA